MLYLNFSLRSDAGRIRGNNEDNFYWNGQYRQDITCMKSALDGTAVPDQKVLAAVCDGMGGEACGEIASLMAVRASPALCLRRGKRDGREGNSGGK